MQGKDEKNAKIYKKRYPGTAESRNTEERGESPNMIQDYGRRGKSRAGRKAGERTGNQIALEYEEKETARYHAEQETKYHLSKKIKNGAKKTRRGELIVAKMRQK